MSFINIQQVWAEHEKWMTETFLIENNTITILPNDKEYWITWDRLDTKEKLLGWVYHLTGKVWITTAIIHGLMDICQKKFKYDLGCP